MRRNRRSEHSESAPVELMSLVPRMAPENRKRFLFIARAFAVDRIQLDPDIWSCVFPSLVQVKD